MELDFIITDSDVPKPNAASPAKKGVKDIAEQEGFEYKEHKLSMSLDALIAESAGPKARKGKLANGASRGAAGPIRTKLHSRPVGRRGGSDAMARKPTGFSISLTVVPLETGGCTVRFGELEILQLKDGHVALSSAGQRTAEVKAALNVALAPFGYRVAPSPSPPHEWMVSGQNKTMRFHDGLVLFGAQRFAELPADGVPAYAPVFVHAEGGGGSGAGRGRGGRGGGRGAGAASPFSQRQQQQGLGQQQVQALPIRQPEPSENPQALAADASQAFAAPRTPKAVFARLGPRHTPY